MFYLKKKQKKKTIKNKEWKAPASHRECHNLSWQAFTRSSEFISVTHLWTWVQNWWSMSWQWARPVLLDDLLFTSGFRSNPLDTMYSFFIYSFYLIFFLPSPLRFWMVCLLSMVQYRAVNKVNMLLIKPSVTRHTLHWNQFFQILPYCTIVFK